MSLDSGQTLSFYEILGPLGAGGMGEVYRARDTRLEREVAIKVLPETFADDADRLRRFEREAKTLASLNHPNVAGIFGVDQVDGTCFLALELVPGEDLATRLQRGAMETREALDVCRQIAEGLEAAHEAGVVHRDLKPANVRLTPDGGVKILDFGLAKPMGPPGSPEGGTIAEDDSFLVTEQGMVMGTPTYMSPEQARGKPVDRRTDIWAFGCVLYECLTGTRAFHGDSMTDLLAAIVGTEPDWSLLPVLPARVTELLHRCLDKDPRTRLRDAGEARVQLQLAADELATGAGASRSTPLKKEARNLKLAALFLGLLAVGYVAGEIDEEVPGGASDRGGSAAKGAAPRGFFGVLMEFQADDGVRTLKISPDGRRVAWVQEGMLWVRELDEPRPRKLVNQEVGAFAWSPDGTQLAWLGEQTVRRTSLDGGASETLADIDAHQLAWLDDGRLTLLTNEGVLSIPEMGGEPETLMTIDREVTLDLHGVCVLPGGLGVLTAFHEEGRVPTAVEWVHDGQRHTLLSFDDPLQGGLTLTPDGGELLVQTVGSTPTLWAVPLTLGEVPTAGTPRMIAEDAKSGSVARDGTLVYLSTPASGTSRLAWIERDDGSVTPFGREFETLDNPKLSPDRRQIAFGSRRNGRASTWVHELERDFSTVRVHGDTGYYVSWFLPDGRLAVSGLYGTPAGSVAYASSGLGEPEQLSPNSVVAVTPDLEQFLVAELVGNPTGIRFTSIAAGEQADSGTPLFSPDERGWVLGLSEDGRWLLFTSDRTGETQIYLSRFPRAEHDEAWLVSAEGGGAAWFSAAGDEILFTDDHQVMSVSLDAAAGSEPRLGAPLPLFPLPVGVDITDYDGTRRFLGVAGDADGPTRVMIDTAWASRR